MRIAAGIITWQDGAALDNCLESVRGVVDEILIADGLIDGIDSIGLAPFSPLGGIADNARVVHARWRSQSQQRDWTLQTARQLGCDWLLAIDADEELRNRDALRPWLEMWRYDAFPIPFYFTDEHAAHPAAFKCLHVPYWRRYVCQGSFLENQQGEVVQVNGQTLWTSARQAGLPYLVHRPELRPEARQSIRLSEHEVTLEPYPENVKAWVEPVHAPILLTPDGSIGSLEEAGRAGVPVWYCPACGRRYVGPGHCTREHPPEPLERLEVAAPCEAL